MHQHRRSEGRSFAFRGGRTYQGTGIPKKTPAPPDLKEGQVRCKCGAAVRLRKDGTLMGHNTLVSKVPCIHVGSEPLT